jgi:2-polyprenyl-3-methyl-5-hydroxy-6-metoxy-1,4-benzoquinol methylase
MDHNELCSTRLQIQDMKRRSLGHLAGEFEAVEYARANQSRSFMSDALPHIYRLFSNWPADKTLTVLDVGANTGAGAALLADLHHPASCSGLKMAVTALDISDLYIDYASVCFPSIDYVVQDIFSIPPDRQWDLVIASHVIEHVEAPFNFLARLKQLARLELLVLCPFDEKNRIEEHLNTIDREFVDRAVPTEYHIYTNITWRNRGECLLMVFDGTMRRPATTR